MNNFKNLDFLGIKPQIYKESQTRLRTCFGALISVLVFLASSSVSIFFFVQTLKRAEIRTVESSETSQTNSLEYSKYNQIVAVTKPLNKLFSFEEEDMLFTPVINYNYVEDPDTMIQLKRTIVMDRCTKEHLGPQADLFSDISDLEHYFCFPKNLDLLLYGVHGGTKPFSLFFISLDFCQAGKNGKKACFEEKLMKSMLSNVYINFAYLDYNIQNDNIETPGNLFVRSKRFKASSTISTRVEYYLQIVNYETDVGFFFKDMQSEKLFLTSYFTILTDFDTRVDFFKLHGSLEWAKKNITRSFEKLEQLAAKIGGVIKTIMIVGEVLTYIASENVYFDQLAEAIYEMEVPQFMPKSKLPNSNESNISIKKEAVAKEKFSNCELIKLRLFCGRGSTKGKTFYSNMKLVKELLSVETLLKTVVCFNKTTKERERQENIPVEQRIRMVVQRREEKEVIDN